MSPTPCQHVTPPVGWYDPNTSRRARADWQPITEDADLDPGEWAGNIYQCRQCHATWYMFWNPRDMLFDDAFDLPAPFRDICRRSITADHLRPVLAFDYGPFTRHEANALRWQVSYALQRATYPAQPVFDLLIAMLNQADQRDEVYELLKWQSTFLVGDVVQQRWRRDQSPVVALTDIVPWLDALALWPEETANVIKAAVDWKQLEVADRVWLSSEDRAALLWSADLADSAAPDGATRAGRPRAPEVRASQQPPRTARRKQYRGSARFESWGRGKVPE
jgi:hypothetical protein